MSPLQQIAVGCVLGMIALGVPMACTASGGLTPFVRCQLDALEVLPKDVGQVTVMDAIDIYERVHRCRAEAGDAGR